MLSGILLDTMPRWRPAIPHRPAADSNRIALASYQQAASIDPTPQAKAGVDKAKQQIAAGDAAAKQKQYTDLMSQGAAAAHGGDLNKALAAYTEAQAVNNTPEVQAAVSATSISNSPTPPPRPTRRSVKLFKLTAAVTSVVPILRAIRKVFEKYPASKAGVTLANSFPTLAFRPSRSGGRWEEGVVVGMSGEGVTPISNLTLAQAVPEGIEISGNAGPMTYKAAMDFLALGVKTVQFCTIATKHGYGIINELESGTSFLMQARGFKSMQELIGAAQPHPIVDFMALSPVKWLSEANDDLCVACGNCARCPYLAIELDSARHPHTNPALCIGCSICVQKCLVGAMQMRVRTPEELSALVEN